MAKSSTTLPVPTPSSNENQTHNHNYNTPKKSLLNLDPLSVKPSSSYTSLKDVLPFSAAAAVNSPASSHHHRHVSIRNRLVKQAAWAYLQPMSPSPSGPSGPQFFRRIHNNTLGACLSFIYHHIVPSLTRILHAIPCCLLPSCS